MTTHRNAWKDESFQGMLVEQPGQLIAFAITFSIIQWHCRCNQSGCHPPSRKRLEIWNGIKDIGREEEILALAAQVGVEVELL
jgi:hypothetical protein